MQMTPAILAQRTHCKNGHPFNEENTRWEGNVRRCRMCAAIRTKKYLDSLRVLGFDTRARGPKKSAVPKDFFMARSALTVNAFTLLGCILSISATVMIDAPR